MFNTRGGRFLMIASLLLSASVAAQDHGAMTEEHLAAAERVVNAFEIPADANAMMERVIQRLRRRDPLRGEALAKAAKPFYETRQIGNVLKGFVASELDLESCRIISEYFEGPVGRKYMELKGKDREPLLTDAEREIENRFLATRSGLEWKRVMPLVMGRLDEYIEETKRPMSVIVEEELAKAGRSK